MPADDKKIFFVLHDPIHNDEHRLDDPQNEHVHLATPRYLTDGSEERIEGDFDDALHHFIHNMAEEKSGFARMEGSPPYTYCMNDSEGFMNSFFVIWFATWKLRKDQRALDAFFAWLETVVVGWANSQKLKVEVLRDKPSEYWRKFIITIPIAMIGPPHTGHETETTATV